MERNGTLEMQMVVREGPGQSLRRRIDVLRCHLQRLSLRQLGRVKTMVMKNEER
jgi:hypothetical protein